MTKKEFRELLIRCQKEECTPEEREYVEKWMDSIVSHEPDFSMNDTKKKQQLRKHILRATQPELKFSEKDNMLATGKNKWYWASAAIVIISCGLFLLKDSFREKQPVSNVTVNKEVFIEGVIQNNQKEVKEVKPGDGSVISLESGGIISIAPAFNKAKERIVHLEGKAFFKVAHDSSRPFIVITKNLITKVLGTSFSIDAEKGKTVTVEVKTGKVAVYRNRGKKIHLNSDPFVSITANHKIRFDSLSNTFVKSIVEKPAIIPTIEREVSSNKSKAVSDFQNTQMKFEEVSAVEILKALEEAYGVKIKFDESKISGCIITASMDSNDFYVWLQTICDLIGGKYQVRGNEIELSSPGCK